MKRFDRLLAALILIEVAIQAWLASSGRIPAGHDGFQYFYTKYYFMNSIVTDGSVPSWIPYLTHGTSGSWWYVIQGGIFDNIISEYARLIGAQNFLPFFYFLAFAERLVLIGGTWLLAGEFLCHRYSRFLVTAAIAGTSISSTQAWWNFHTFYALPLIFYFLKRWWDTFQWRHLIAAGLLGFLQEQGQLQYFLPMTLLVIAAFAVAIVCTPTSPQSPRRKFQWERAGLIGLAVIAAIAVFELNWLHSVSQEIAMGTSSRLPDGSVPLKTFLNYAQNTDLRNWTEIFTGISPYLDMTLFAGFGISILLLSTGFILPLSSAQKKFGAIALFFLLICSASPLAVLLYYVWPAMKFFRHLSLVSPVAKVFIIFFSGITLDRLMDSAHRPSRTALMVSAVQMSLWLGLLALSLLEPDSFSAFQDALTNPVLPLMTDPLIATKQVRSVLFAIAIAATFWLATIQKPRRKSKSEVMWAVFSILAVADIYSYQYMEALSRTVVLQPMQAAVFDFQKFPFVSRRAPAGADAWNERRRAFDAHPVLIPGARYWSEDLLWFADAANSDRTTVIWAPAIEEFRKVSTGDPAAATGWPSYSKIIGLTTDKIRFYGRAIACASFTEIGESIRNPAYEGKVLLISSPVSSQAPPEDCSAASVQKADESSRALELPWNVQEFSSDRFKIEVTNTLPQSVWMSYADAWDPSWEAAVDSAPSPLFRAWIGYKAVQVPPGKHTVEFRHSDLSLSILYGLHFFGGIAFLVLLWACIGSGTTTRGLRFSKISMNSFFIFF